MKAALSPLMLCYEIRPLVIALGETVGIISVTAHSKDLNVEFNKVALGVDAAVVNGDVQACLEAQRMLDPTGEYHCVPKLARDVAVTHGVHGLVCAHFTDIYECYKTFRCMRRHITHYDVLFHRQKRVFVPLELVEVQCRLTRCVSGTVLAKISNASQR